MKGVIWHTLKDVSIKLIYKEDRYLNKEGKRTTRIEFISPSSEQKKYDKKNHENW